MSTQDTPPAADEIRRLQRRVGDLEQRLEGLERHLAKAVVVAGVVLLALGQVLPFLRGEDGSTLRLLPVVMRLQEVPEGMMGTRATLVSGLLLALAIAALVAAYLLVDERAVGARTVLGARVAAIALLVTSALGFLFVLVLSGRQDISRWSPALACFLLGAAVTLTAARLRDRDV